MSGCRKLWKKTVLPAITEAKFMNLATKFMNLGPEFMHTDPEFMHAGPEFMHLRTKFIGRKAAFSHAVKSRLAQIPCSLFAR